MKPILLLLACTAVLAAQTPDDAAKMKATLDRQTAQLKDWPNLNRYRADNAKLAPPAAGEERVVFMGDSITDGWGRRYGQFFPGKPYVNRGISGQTTPQMLLRFRADVIDLHPKAVVILAGTNDISGNTGPMTLEETEANLMSMAELARAHGIKVVLAALLPTCDYIRPQTERRPNEKINELNTWMRGYAAGSGAIYLDYHTATQDEKKVFRKELTYDGLHPNAAGYEVMGPLAQQAIDEALGR